MCVYSEESEYSFLWHADFYILTPHQLGFPIGVSSLRALFIIIRNKWMQLLLQRSDKFLTFSRKNRSLAPIGGNLQMAHQKKKKKNHKRRKTEASNLKVGVLNEKEEFRKNRKPTKVARNTFYPPKVLSTLQKIKHPPFPR